MAGYQYQFGYPSYQNVYQSPQMNYQQSQIPTQPQVQNTGILYVDGDKGAEEFQMLPNTFAFLKSTSGKAVYFKQSLANGAISCDKFILDESIPKIPTKIDYVTRKEFEEFVKSVKENRYESNEKSNGSNAKHSKPNARTSKLQNSDEPARNN